MTTLPSDPSDPLGLRYLTKPAAEVCKKIIDKVSAATGTVYGDWAMVIRARRQAEARRLLGGADLDVEVQRRIALARVEREIDAEAVLHRERLEDRAQQRMLNSALREQVNIEAITTAAIEYVCEQAQGGEVQNPVAEPSADWMADFIDLCKNTSDENMRKLWARTLAGEVQRPGSFSIRSLLALKTLLPAEAELFRKAANLVLSGEWVFRGPNNEAIVEFGLPFGGYGGYLELAAAGLFISETNTELKIVGDPVQVTYEPYVLLFKRNEDYGADEPMEIELWKLSAVGRELTRLIPLEHNWAYIRLFVELQEQRGWKRDVLLVPQGFPAPPGFPTQHDLKSAATND